MRKLITLAVMLAIALVAVVPAVAQISQEESERRITSGKASPSVGISNKGDQVNVCPTDQQIGQTGNVANEQGATQYNTTTDDIDFSGSSIDTSPSLAAECDQSYVLHPPPPDLVPTSACIVEFPSSTLTPGVTNIGGPTTDGFVSTLTFLPTGTGFPGETRPLPRIDSLGPGEHRDYPTEIVPPGADPFSVTVDSNSEEIESNETNNTLSSGCPTGEPPPPPG